MKRVSLFITMFGVLFAFSCEDAGWWSCSASGTNAVSANISDMIDYIYFTPPDERAFGQSVRCCKE